MLDFLSQVTVEDVKDSPRSGGGGPRKERNPSGLAIRLFYDGSIYPSQDLTDQFGLEYVGKDMTSEDADSLETGYGLDIFSSEDYANFKLPAGKKVILANFAKKTEPKVDVFGQTGYDEEGSPLASVMDQGAKTFGKGELIAMVEDVYGIKLAKEGEGTVKSIDLVFVGNPNDEGNPWPAGKNGKGLAFLPKAVSRGKDKGAMTSQRRENAKLFVLAPATVLEPQEETAEGGQPLEAAE